MLLKMKATKKLAWLDVFSVDITYLGSLITKFG